MKYGLNTSSRLGFQRKRYFKLAAAGPEHSGVERTSRAKYCPSALNQSRC